MKKSISLFLVITLLLPSLAQAFHVFDKHEHEHFCIEKKVHIHATRQMQHPKDSPMFVSRSNSIILECDDRR